MNKYLHILTIFFLFACSSEDSSKVRDFTSGEMNDAAMSSFTINGQITGAENKTLYVETFTDRGRIEAGKATADASGKFQIEGTIPGFGEYYLRMGEAMNNIIPMVITPNDKITIKGEASTFKSNTKIGGTEWSDLMTEFLPLYGDFMVKMEDMKLKAPSMSEIEQVEFYVDAKKEVEIFSLEKMKTDPSNSYNLILFKNTIPGYDSQIAWNQDNNVILNNVVI